MSHTHAERHAATPVLRRLEGRVRHQKPPVANILRELDFLQPSILCEEIQRRIALRVAGQLPAAFGRFHKNQRQHITILFRLATGIAPTQRCQTTAQRRKASANTRCQC